MKYRHLIGKSATAGVAVLVVLGAMAWLSGWLRGDKIQPAQLWLPTGPAPATQPVPVEKVSRTRYADVVGSIQAEVRTSVSSRLIANIIEMRVRAGDRVKKDDLLVLLDDAGPKARVAQATESLRSAQASQDLAELEVNRLSRLSEQQAASTFELDEWKAKLNVAKADVAKAQETIREAQSVLADTQIRSPIDGIIIDRQAEPGEQASPGRALLTLYDPSKLRLEANVREAYVGRLKLGQKITVLIESARQQRAGTVSQIVPAADPSSRTFLVKISLDDSSDLYPGMYARMSVPLDVHDQLEIPLASVKRVGQLDLVDVVIDGRVQRRAVRLGPVTGDRVEVLAGLSQGEQVVAE